MQPILQPPDVGNRASLGLLAVRLVAGTAFLLHGWGKIQHPMSWMPDGSIPGVLQACAALAEFGGGALWILGAFTPIAALGILVTMTVALSFHVRHGDPFVGMDGPSFESALGYLATALLLLLAGPGRLSIDAVMARRR